MKKFKVYYQMNSCENNNFYLEAENKQMAMNDAKRAVGTTTNILKVEEVSA